MQETWHKYLGEAFGTFLFVFLAAGSVLAHGTTGLGVLGIALATGFALLVAAYVSGHLSGAHINPAVTVAMWATGRMHTLVGLGYIISQLVGSVVAALLLNVVFGSASDMLHLGNVAVGSGVTAGVAILTEAILTFFLVYTYFATVVDKHEHGEHGGLALGLVLAASILVSYTITGGALNPARAFGPALVSADWNMHYVYWVGPLIGALVAGFVYHFGFLKRRG